MPHQMSRTATASTIQSVDSTKENPVQPSSMDKKGKKRAPPSEALPSNKRTKKNEIPVIDLTTEENRKKIPIINLTADEDGDSMAPVDYYEPILLAGPSSIASGSKLRK